MHFFQFKESVGLSQIICVDKNKMLNILIKYDYLYIFINYIP